MRILLGIFLLGFILRVIFLDVAPPGFNADEAALGYNAYSIIKTGKDEWGTSFPLVFKSFSDYKPGLYVYLTIPFVWLLGLNEFSVRIPSILLGSFSIVLIYFLSKELFKKEAVALACAFLLSISPWHLHFSRGAWETNAATFFILLGVYTFIKSFKNHRLLWISAAAFIASMYTYQSPRVVVPGLILLFIIFYWKRLVVKKNIPVVVLAVILLLPLVFILVSTAGLARFKGVSIFSDTGPINPVNEERGQHQDPSSFWIRFFHNKAEVYARNFFGHYLDHFNPNFLFTLGDPLKRNKVPDMGQMYIFEIVTLVSGLYFIIRSKFSNTKVVFLWLLVAPLASSLTYQTPHALRVHNMVIPLTLISGLGLGMLWENLPRLAWSVKYLAKSAVVIVIGLSVVSYLDRYYLHLPKQYALEWEYGFSQVIPYIVENQNNYQKIIITDRYDQPYILLLFYSKYDPARYHKQNKEMGEDKFGFFTITSFDKFNFRPIGKEEIHKSKNTLYIGTNEEIGEDQIPLKVINFPNGIPAFKIVGT
ncbi:glycosyltransferase family 39 protein [Candidatus Daviesbacteria bacterium]|nr:glycosyltransferase family 39 protein [Candidatus Daviesbacteria bacterium]